MLACIELYSTQSWVGLVKGAQISRARTALAAGTLARKPKMATEMVEMIHALKIAHRSVAKAHSQAAEPHSRTKNVPSGP